MSTPHPLSPAGVSTGMRPVLTGNADPAHDWYHLVRVFQTGGRIVRALRAGWETTPWAARVGDLDEAALRIALLTHDLRPKPTPDAPNPPVRPDELAALFPASPETARRAAQAVNEHSWSRGLSPTTIESAILQDADRLDAIGALGIARCMAYSGAHGRPIHAPDRPVAPDRDAVQHVLDKLLLIRGRLNLSVSDELAAGRHEFLGMFLDQFQREAGGNHLPPGGADDFGG